MRNFILTALMCITMMSYALPLTAEDSYEGWSFSIEGVSCQVNYWEEDPIEINVVYSEGHNDLREVVLPETIMVKGFSREEEGWDQYRKGAIVRIGKNAFAECRISSIVLPPSLKAIDEMAFSGAWLKHIEIPSGPVYIGRYAFAYAGLLESVQIPESVIMIDEGAFREMMGLKSISLPSTLKALGGWVFKHTGFLKDIYCYATEPPIASGTDFGFIENENREISMKMPGPMGCTLHVPEQSIDLYKAAEGWGWFRHIVPLETSEIEEHFAEIEGEIEYEVENGNLQVSLRPGDNLSIFDLKGSRLLYEEAVTRKDIVYEGKGVVILKVNNRSAKIML